MQLPAKECQGSLAPSGHQQRGTGQTLLQGLHKEPTLPNP